MVETTKIDQLLPMLQVTCKNRSVRTLRILERLSLLLLDRSKRLSRFPGGPK